MQLKLILILLLLLASGGFYTYYTSVQKKLNTYEYAVEQQEKTIKELQDRSEKQKTSLVNLINANSDLQKESRELSNKLMKHDLEELSKRKPALIETRINNGTQELFDSFNTITSK